MGLAAWAFELVWPQTECRRSVLPLQVRVRQPTASSAAWVLDIASALGYQVDAIGEVGPLRPDDLGVNGFNNMPFISRPQPPLTPLVVLVSLRLANRVTWVNRGPRYPPDRSHPSAPSASGSVRIERQPMRGHPTGTRPGEAGTLPPRWWRACRSDTDAVGPSWPST